MTAPPRSGKTEYALAALLRELQTSGDSDAVMSVSGRVAADRLGNRVIRSLGALSLARPVTTLQAIAFRVIEAMRSKAGLSAPRLLNGAEQDAMLRRVVATHLHHVAAGDECATCRLLREYFAQDEWASLVADTSPESQFEAPQSGGTSTAKLLERGISGAFIDQLRDMLARMDELGVTPGDEDGLLAALGQGNARLRVQWRLAFALRAEYIAALVDAYPGEYRIDASYLLVAGAHAVRESSGAATGLPGMLIVDDFQDTTLAGMRFLEAAHEAGTRLLLVGNPDEAVQTFRGSYPEYLFRRAQEGPLKAEPHDRRIFEEERHDTGQAAEGGDATKALDMLAARVSLSIPSEEEDTTPIARRPGKLAQPTGTLPDDGGLSTALYRSPREELDDVVWRIKRARLDGHAAWNDMAVIAHDNVTVRLFGERLRRDGVPVRYSSVTRPLKDEPFVRGLFALIELARLRREGVGGCGMGLSAVASYVRSRVVTLLEGPLITTGRPGEGRPARIAPIESAIAALESLASVVNATGDAGESENAENAVNDAITLPKLVEDWGRLRDKAIALRAQREDTGASSGKHDDIAVDDSLIDPSAAMGDDLGFGSDAMHVMLAFDDPSAPAEDAVAAICAVLGADPQCRAFTRLWHLVDKVARGWERLDAENPNHTQAQQVLALAWDAVGVARPWQTAALTNTADGRAANDRLDAAMRLFQFAEGATGDIADVIARVRSLEIEADSLAHIGPVEDAVTLTTPAGAAGQRFRLVWLPAIQQDAWPNLTERNTMFGGEDLAELVLRGRLADVAATGRDPHLVSVLSSEKKSLLVALTRADERVSLSAVWNDDLSPSDFLFGYLPERYPRDRTQARITAVGQDGDCAGLDASPRGLVAKARAVLATSEPDGAASQDAASALALLASHGVEEAEPDHWAFVHADAEHMDDADAKTKETAEETTDETTPDRAPVVTLSPSAVDRLWACPVCWLLENRFSGPRPGSVATGFGSLIHEVACLGSRNGLDLDGHDTQKVADQLMEIYRSLRPDPAAIADPRQRYEAIRRDESASDVLSHIAAYFAEGADDAHLGKNADYFTAGRLEQVDCEKEFAARFGLDDILAAYNAVPDAVRASRSELMAMMGALVGGWPEGMDERIIVRLSGRIDRLETRRLADDSVNLRLIDYKTGHGHSTKEQFNDLQLVCYQLGLVFPEDGPRGRKALAIAPHIGQSLLFDVGEREAPGYSRAPEGAFQPPLFVDGALDAHPLTPRYWYKDKASYFLDLPDLDADMPPQGVNEATWRGFVALRGTQVPWALTMIARVIYAAAASRSSLLVARPQPSHAASCRLTRICPACAGQIDTVFETRQA